MGNREFRAVNATLAAAESDVAEYPVADVDVLNIDVESTGTGALTAFRVLARISPSAPYRDISPSWGNADGYIVVAPASTSPTALAAGAFTLLALNVTRFDAIKIRAAGASAAIRLCASGVQE